MPIILENKENLHIKKISLNGGNSWANLEHISTLHENDSFLEIDKWIKINSGPVFIKFRKNGNSHINFNNEYVIGKSYFSKKRIKIYLNRFLYIEILEKYKINDLNKIALMNHFIAIEKDDKIINCHQDLDYCNKNCILYNKCSYNVMKKLCI